MSDIIHDKSFAIAINQLFCNIFVQEKMKYRKLPKLIIPEDSDGQTSNNGQITKNDSNQMKMF